jgi:uncharacterized protein (DUF169 family)
MILTGGNPKNMNPLSAREKAGLIRKYLAEHGVPPELELIEEELDNLTEEEQRELMRDCEALAEGRQKGAKSLRQFIAENDL